MYLADVRAHADRLGRIVYIATVRPDGRPHNAPVGIAWIEDTVCAFVMNPSVKVTNIRNGSPAHMHWAVSPETGNDSLVLEGTVTVIDTEAGRAKLWDDMGYDLAEFEPDGPASNNHVFLQVAPKRATLLYRFGFDGRETWEADDYVIDLTATDTPTAIQGDR